MLRNESWTKDTTSDAVLAHEQLHFDIAEVYGRKLRKAIRNVSDRQPESFSKVIQPIFAEEIKMQDQYDRETSHGTYTNRQDAWRKKLTGA